MRKKLLMALALSLAALGMSAAEARAGWNDDTCQGPGGKAVACCSSCFANCVCTAGPVKPA